LQIGIVGLPNAGKSTLFNALTRGDAKADRYPFTTIEPNAGIVAVPDKRLESLRQLVDAREVTPATIKFLDIAGLIQGASKGEGLGNQFLAKIREVEAIVHLVRCFSDPQITHITSDLNPDRDIEIVNLELALADLELLEKRREKIKKDSKATKEVGLLDRTIEALRHQARPKLSEEDSKALEGYQLLALKPVLYVANLGEKESLPAAFRDYNAIGISAKLESELQELPENLRSQFRAEIGAGETGLEKVIKASYCLLGLITFFTLENGKLRAWTLGEGKSILAAAGKIHSDMARGFIKAEVTSFSDLVAAGSLAQVRMKGLLGIEGKDYRVREGDIVTIKFRV
jgi:GTP-binding protein YchF